MWKSRAGVMADNISRFSARVKPAAQYPHPMGMRLAITLIAAMLACTGTAGAQQEEQPPASDAPVALPAEALSFAADLEKHAQPKLLDWARKHARELLRDEFTADELTADSITKLFPSQPAPVREAIRYLVGVQAYRRVSQQHESRASSLRDLDRDIRDLEDRLRMIEAMGAPIGSVAAQQREANLVAGENQMETMQTRRKLLVNGVEEESKRVDACLRWLAGAYPGVKDSPAEILRAVPPPRS